MLSLLCTNTFCLPYLVVCLCIIEDQLHIVHDFQWRPVNQTLQAILDDLEIHRVLDDLVIVWDLQHNNHT